MEMAVSDLDPQGLGYWVRWQVAVCALTFVVPAAASLSLLRRQRAESLRSVDLWMSCWRGLHPVWLLIYRAFAFLCMAFLLFRFVSETSGVVFYFYTQWTFVLVMVYFALGTIISANGCWMTTKKPTAKTGERDELLNNEVQQSKLVDAAASKSSENTCTLKLRSCYNQVNLQSKAGFWGYLMQTLYQTCAGAVVLTDLVFWVILVPLLSKVMFTLTLIIGCMHSLNAFFLIVDSSINNLPFHWLGIAYFLLWSCLYGVFQWVIHMCGVKWWPYPFLDLGSPWAPLWYFGMALIHIPCYGIYVLLMTAKYSIFSRFFPKAFLSTNNSATYSMFKLH